jgi:hypothetical protein
MNASFWALFVFVTQMAGWFVGRIVRSRLPPEHLTSSTRDAVVLAAGTVATLAALVLGLMISSAKASFDADRASVVEIATNILLIDRALAHYGDNAKAARETLRGLLQRAIDSVSASELQSKASDSGSPLPVTDQLQTSLLALVPANDGQRWVQTRALTLSAALERARVLYAERSDGSIPVAFLIVLTAWLAMLYLAFAIFAPINATVTATAWGGALALSAAIFLIIELDTPFHGMISLSAEPLVKTLELLGR